MATSAGRLAAIAAAAGAGLAAAAGPQAPRDAARPPAPARRDGRAAAAGDLWRGAERGWTVEQVLAAFPGEARRLDPEERLADGNVVAAGIERHDLAGEVFRVRFVFEKGRLALVSLRTPPDRYAGADVYQRVARHLAARLGGPGEESRDATFVDMRQTRWRTAAATVDLKYIPGVVVVLHAPPAEGGSGGG
jgi:hypothetical protein